MDNQLNENVVSIYIIYQIIKKLVTPFDKTDAYKLGIIDKNGKVLRKRATLKTIPEKQAYTMLDTLVFNLKKILEKIPGGKSQLATFAAAMWLIKESKNHEHYILNDDLLEEDYIEFFKDYTLDESSESMLEMIKIAEEIANVTGSGVATDIPFKPKVKTKPEDFLKNFMKMYEDSIKDEPAKDPAFFKLVRRTGNTKD